MKRYAVTFMVDIDASDKFDPADWIYESIQNQLNENDNEYIIDFICEELEEN